MTHCVPIKFFLSTTWFWVGQKSTQQTPCITSKRNSFLYRKSSWLRIRPLKGGWLHYLISSTCAHLVSQIVNSAKRQRVCQLWSFNLPNQGADLIKQFLAKLNTWKSWLFGFATVGNPSIYLADTASQIQFPYLKMFCVVSVASLRKLIILSAVYKYLLLKSLKHKFKW